MIEYDVDVHVECDECGCDMGDSSKVYCYSCAKKIGIEKENGRFEDVVGGDNRNLVEVLEAEKKWNGAVRLLKVTQENSNVV